MNASNWVTVLTVTALVSMSGQLAAGPLSPSESGALGRVTIQATSPNTPNYKSLSGVNFQPRGSVNTTAYVDAGCIYLSKGTRVVAQLDLPDGAIIKSIEMFYSRGQSNQMSEMTVYKYDHTIGAQVSSFTVSATHTGISSDLSADQLMVVDNTKYTYQAEWLAASSFDNLLCGARVAYYPLPQGSTYTPVTPCRLIDTRTTDAPNLTPAGRTFQISGVCGVPAGATAVAVNVTTDQTTDASVMAIFPSGIAWPGNSTLNWSAGQIVANSAILPLGADGKVQAVVGVGSAALILDIAGFFY